MFVSTDEHLCIVVTVGTRELYPLCGRYRPSDLGQIVLEIIGKMLGARLSLPGMYNRWEVSIFRTTAVKISQSQIMYLEKLRFDPGLNAILASIFQSFPMY